jgi:predicted RNase H-like nuclease (RuvC/YqgF family)
MSYIHKANTYIDKFSQCIDLIVETITKKKDEKKNLEANLEEVKEENKELEAYIDKIQVLNQTWAEKNESLFAIDQEIAKLKKELASENSKFESNRKYIESLDK